MSATSPSPEFGPDAAMAALAQAAASMTVTRLATLPPRLEQQLASVHGGRPAQGVMLTVSDRDAQHAVERPLAAALAAHAYGLPVGTVHCRTSLRWPELTTTLRGALLARSEYSEDPQSLRLPAGRPGCLLLAGADILPNAAWRELLLFMKACNRHDEAVLVVALTPHPARLSARLYGLDGDSSMMWTRAQLSDTALITD